MKDILSRPTILFGTNYVDYSTELCDFAQDTATITWTTNDSLFVGLDKPITSLFFWPSTVSTSNRTLTVSMYNSSTAAWDSLTSCDDTKGLTRAGFVSWILSSSPMPSESTVNSIEKYWHKFTVSAATSSIVLRSISGLFSDDIELQKEFPTILGTEFLKGQSNHYLIHETVRNDIVQEFRKRGMRRQGNDGYWKKFTCYDIMDVDEVRTAATYLALSKVFNNVANSGKDDDNWKRKSGEYFRKYQQAINTAYVTWDKYSDGSKDIQSNVSTIILTR